MEKLLQTGNLWLILAVVGVLTVPGQAQAFDSMDKSMGSLFATARLTAQAADSVVQITDIRLEVTETGLQILLETAEGELTAPTTSISGNALIAEISNATLAGAGFEQFEPTEEIAVVQVTELPGNQVQVVITGADAPPMAEINSTTAGLALNLTPGIAQAGAVDDPLRLVVTGEEGSDYFEPNASTATRTDTPLRDIPQSIQVIPREVLEDQQVISLSDALRNASGVQLTQRSFGEVFVIRGFSNPVTLRDGLRLVQPGNTDVGFQEISNLESIEVLKGPASILFGAIQPGGVINLVTKKPLSEPFYEVGVRAGNREFIEPRIDLSGPLTEDGSLLYRLNAFYRRADSYRDFETDEERLFIAPTLQWNISDRTDLTLSLEYADEQRPSDNGLVAVGDEVADVPFDRVLQELDDIQERETLRISADFEHRFSDNWTLRNAFVYNRSDTKEAYAPSFLSPVDPVTGDTTLNYFFVDPSISETYELQTNVVGEFNTGAIKHKLLFGADLFRYETDEQGRLDFFNPIPFNIFNPVYGTVPRTDPSTLNVFVDRSIQNESLGVYLQDQIDLSEQLKVLLGVRYDTIENKTIGNPAPGVPGDVTTQNEEAVTPRVGLVYQPIEDISLYGSYSRSFVPNTATTVSGDFLDPEEGEQFEIGIRAEALDGNLAANLAFFHLTKQNVATTDPDNPFFSIAIGEQRSQGIELDVAGEILPGWNIIANYAYTDADITEDNNGNEGNRLGGVPEHSFNVWTNYEIQTGSLEGLGLGLGFNYVGERIGDNANSFNVDDYFLTNAAVFYKKDNWQTALNFRNLFDVDYIAGTGGGRFFVSPGEGFTVIGSLSVRF
ncbi:MAG: TonB-dependent siderophore receptor [Cyanobacteria bacterium P01_B01_bin.77]